MAHMFPSVGDPVKLTIARFHGLLDRVDDVLDRTNPDLQFDSVTRARVTNQRLLEAGDPKTWALYED